MDLSETRVGHVSAAAGSPPGCRHVAVHRVSRQVEDVAVAAGAQHDAVGGVALQLTGQQVSDDDAAGFTVNQYQVEHLVAVVHFHIAFGDLPGKGLVGPQ